MVLIFFQIITMPPNKKKKLNLPANSPGHLQLYLRDNFSVVPGDGLLKHVLFVFIENDHSYPKTIQALRDKMSEQS